MRSIFKKIIIWILTAEARLVLHKYKPKIITVTGSVGKTSTKDALYTALSEHFHIRKSEKSYNSEIGIPLTILGCASAWSNAWLWGRNIFTGIIILLRHVQYPEWLILEVGADRPLDIANITSWITPNIVILTKFPEVPVHIEFFESRAHLIAEKGSLVKALPQDGLLIYNIDDTDSIVLAKDYLGKKITYGFNEKANVQAINISLRYKEDLKSTLEGMTITLKIKGREQKLPLIGAVGRQHVYPILAAHALGLGLKVPPDELNIALSKHKTPPGRMRLISGIKSTTIIDDTYNSSPVAAMEALNTLKAMEVTGRRIVTFGDMLELGKFSTDEHKKLGEATATTADILATVGIRSRHIAEGALIGGMSEKNIFQFEKAKEAGKFLQDFIAPHDMILIKGSQSMRMEFIVEEIMADPAQKKNLLVRQDSEWGKRQG